MEQQRCPGCGRKSDAENAFCPYCGAPFVMEAPARRAHEQQQPARQTSGCTTWVAIGAGCLLIACLAIGLSNGSRSSYSPPTPRGTTSSAQSASVSRTAPPTRVPTRTPVPVGMSRGNPLPLGDFIIPDDGIELTVLSVDRGATALSKIKGYSSWNSKPDEGMEYVLVLVHLRFTGAPDETERISSGYFRIVGETGAIHEEPWSLSLGKDLAPELFGGGSCDGEVAFEVQQGEGDLVLIYSGSGTKARFLSLEPPAASEAPSPTP